METGSYSIAPWVVDKVLGLAAPRKRGRLSFGRWVRLGDGPFKGQARRSGRINVQGVKTGVELGLEGIVHRPVPGQPRKTCKGLRTHLDRIMGLSARRSARMTVVQVRLVDYIKLCWSKRCNKCRSHALYACCQFLRH